jgi:hypothetical protein
MYLLQKKQNKQSSRRQIDIKAVEDEILVLGDNEHRAILKVNAVNFELKSEAEQDAIIEIYKGFVNSLPCPLQIIVRIRALDLDNYLSHFETSNTTKNGVQIENYKKFIKDLVNSRKILSRNFYIIVPHDSKDDRSVIAEQLNLKCNLISNGLSRLGIRSNRLTNLEIVDMFYNYYNPEKAKRQSITTSTLELLKEANY